MPGRVKYELYIDVCHGGDNADFVFGIANQEFAHAASGCCQGHVDLDGALAVAECFDFAAVNEPELDDVDRDFGVVAGFQLLPDDRFDVLIRCVFRHFGRWHRLLAKRVGVRARDQEQVALEVHRKAPAQRLGDESGSTLAQQQFFAGRDYDCPDVARQRNRFVCVSEHLNSYSVVAGVASWRSAECSACHARVAHFTRDGYSRTPSSARSLPRSTGGRSWTSVSPLRCEVTASK